MRKNTWIIAFLVLCFIQLGMGRRQGQYDEEARAQEKAAKAADKYKAPSPSEAAKRFAEGVKEVTYDGPKTLVSETVDSVKNKNSSSQTEAEHPVLDHTVKG